MNDMSAVIVPKSDQINAEDFLAGPKTYTIEGVAISPGTEQPVSVKLRGEARVWRPCKSMSRVLVSAWGPDAKVYTGRSVTLYRDPKVKWGGMEIGGIRVSHMSHIEREMLLQLTATKGKRAPHVVKPLADVPGAGEQTDWATLAANTIANIGKAPDLAKLDQFIANRMPKLAGMSEAAPDEWQRIDDTLRLRRAELSKANDIPPAFESEGRADDQYGDQHDGVSDDLPKGV